MDANQQYALVEMERALIGALINLSGAGLKAQKAALDSLKPFSISDIYNPTNLSIYSSVASMIVEGTTCTPELLYKRLVDRKTLDDIGGLGTIVQLCKDAASYSSLDAIKGLAGTLFDESRRRKAYQLESIIRQGEADNKPLDDILSDARTLIDSLAEQGKGSKFKLSAWRDISAPKPVDWLIDGALEVNSLACLYGASGCGKSFIAVDLSLCIASGSDWHGQKVKQGSVIYFAGEGREGLRRRVAAWVQNAPECAGSVADYFLLADRACLLPDDATDVIDVLKQTVKPRLLVLDTLNRTMSGDENSTRDMTAYVQACDKIKVAYPELTILIIHHTGHGSQERARGSVALKGALDVELRAARNEEGVISMVGTKAKDTDTLGAKRFLLNGIPLDGWTFEGRPTYSAYLAETNINDELTGIQLGKLSSMQAKAFDALLDLVEEQQNNPTASAGITIQQWANRCSINGAAKYASYAEKDLLPPLIKKGFVASDGERLKAMCNPRKVSKSYWVEGYD